MLRQDHEVSAAGCVSSRNPIFNRALIRTRPARHQLCARVSILEFRRQCRRNFHRERMIVKAEIRTAVSAPFWKGLTLFRKGLTLFWKRHSTLLSRRIRRVIRDALGEAGRLALDWVLIDKAHPKSFGKSSNRGESPSLAAAYVRMSTDLQKYSTENQLHTIRRYAKGEACI